MFGTIWMFSDQIDDEDLLFAQKSFITITMAIDYYGKTLRVLPTEIPLSIIRKDDCAFCLEVANCDLKYLCYSYIVIFYI